MTNLEKNTALDQGPNTGAGLTPTINGSISQAGVNNLRHPSTDPDSNTYPEGGLQAWLCVTGSFMGLVGSLGFINSLGTFQAYLETHQLRGETPERIGWIFSIFTFLAFFCGLQIGPIFDLKGPRLLVLAGSILTTAMSVSLGFCTEYWHFLIAFSLVGGLGVSLVFTPAMAAVSHFFYKKRGLATGIAAAGGSMGGIMFPLILEALFKKTTFAWATRVIALVCFACFLAASLLISSRLPTRPITKDVLPTLSIFRDPKLLFTTLSIFFLDLALFIPITYVSSYALAHGFSSSLSYRLLAILNTGSFFGRLFAGYAADRWGRFNSLIIAVILCLLSNACLWLPCGDSAPLMVTFCFLFGLGSGSNISLFPVCVGQLCKTQDYGRYYATAETMVSISTLLGLPIAGRILSLCNGEYRGLIVFTCACYGAGLVAAVAVKILHGGRNFIFIIY